MGKLSTHVLDITTGKPAAGVAVELYAIHAGADAASSGRRCVCRVVTNSDGRCDAPLLAGDAMVAGRYELVFAAGDYFAAQGVQVPQPRFVDRVTLSFGIASAEENYHVPLLVSPWAYSTYRGS